MCCNITKLKCLLTATIIFNFQLTCCQDSNLMKQWDTKPVTRSQVQEMRVTLGVLMPPWERKMFLDVHIDPNVPLPVTRDFVALLQKNSPSLS